MTKFNQTGGDGSVNIQGGSVNVGLSYSDAKEICEDIFKANFFRLSQEAAELAKLRAEDLVENYLTKLQKQNSLLIEHLSDPDLQYHLYLVQRDYARSGDEKLRGILEDLLVERTKEMERSIKQITLNEAIKVVAKLTNDQINLLSMHFMFAESRFTTIKSFKSLEENFNKFIKPFVPDESPTNSQTMHLDYCKCANFIPGNEDTVARVLKKSYSGLFQKGFHLNEFVGIFPFTEEELIHKKIVMEDPCTSSKYVFNTINFNSLPNKLNNHDKILNLQLEQFYNNQLMDDEMVELILKEMLPTYFSHFIDVWNNSSLPNLILSSVGKVIALTNIKSKVTLNSEVEDWVY
ncbi:LPO_1073/Vpar_1526 family protein [Bacillus spizizenii]|uniref:LPO_1073/Vpar_1526 family protein n=1 Tax=Bacillus spizizenii TaxID=96241 RepID=UPI003D2347DA